MKRLFIIIWLLFCFWQSAFAFDISVLKNYKESVYDETKTLSVDDIQAIKNKIQEIRKKYTVEILTVLINTTDGQDPSQLWVEIGQSVWVWKKDVDNGLVILIVLKDRAWNISTGYGLEWTLPDIITNRIAQENFPTHFKNNDYAGGILGALNDVEWYVAKDPTVVSKLTTTNATDQSSWFLVWYFFIAVFVSAILFQKDLKAGDFKSFWKKFLIIYLISLPISYLFVGLYAIVVNLLIWIFASLLALWRWSGMIGRWGWGGSWWGGSSSWGWFGWGWFGWWGSSGRW